MKINREDVVQAALVVERWCAEHCTNNNEPCDCPFAQRASCFLDFDAIPKYWGLEVFLRKRGLKGGASDDRTPGADGGAN